MSKKKVIVETVEELTPSVQPEVLVETEKKEVLSKGDQKVKTTEKNKYHKVGTILTVAENVAEILIKKGYAVLSK